MKPTQPLKISQPYVNSKVALICFLNNPEASQEYSRLREYLLQCATKSAGASAIQEGLLDLTRTFVKRPDSDEFASRFSTFKSEFMAAKTG